MVVFVGRQAYSEEDNCKANIFLKLDLPPGEENRRVRAVLAWVRAHA